MNHHEEAPKLSKLPFIVGDLALIATAVLIAYRGPSPLTPVALLAIALCVIAGAALLVIPFMADYARRADADIADRQNQIAALARVTSESAEQLGIVASGLNGISESSKHNLGALEKLPAQLKTRIDELTRALSGSALAAQSSVKDDIARLEAAAEKLTPLLARLETASKLRADTLAASEKDLAASLDRAAAQLDAFTTKAAKKTDALAKKVPSQTPPVGATLRRDDAPVEPPEAPAPESPATPVADNTPPPPEPAVTPEPPAPEPAIEPAAFTPAEPATDEVPVDEPPAPKPPRARKPKPAEDDIPDLGLTPDAAESSESSVTSDGFTRLIATAYIGIGNKLYVRGDGPGLSWDKGVPLQFVSIGKWRWETPDATASIKAKLYKNDQIECQGLGTLTLEPGRQHEVNAGF